MKEELETAVVPDGVNQRPGDVAIAQQADKRDAQGMVDMVWLWGRSLKGGLVLQYQLSSPGGVQLREESGRMYGEVGLAHLPVFQNRGGLPEDIGFCRYIQILVDQHLLVAIQTRHDEQVVPVRRNDDVRL